MTLAGSGHRDARRLYQGPIFKIEGRREWQTLMFWFTARHTGAEMEAVAGHLRKSGHVVHCPTVAGNNKDDDRETTGLEQAIASIVAYIEANNLRDIRLVGYSYGGMVIPGVADRLTDRIKRLVYVNAFVPLDGQCLNDMVPPHYVGLFDAVAAANKGAVMLPFEIWRDAFINDADLELAKSAFAKLNLHPYKTFTDKITLKHALAELPVGKSYVNCRQDIAPAAQHAMASAVVGAAGAVPAGRMRRQPRDVLQQPGAAGAGDRGGRARLSALLQMARGPARYAEPLILSKTLLFENAFARASASL